MASRIWEKKKYLKAKTRYMTNKASGKNNIPHSTVEKLSRPLYVSIILDLDVQPRSKIPESVSSCRFIYIGLVKYFIIASIVDCVANESTLPT